MGTNHGSPVLEVTGSRPGVGQGLEEEVGTCVGIT